MIAFEYVICCHV